MFPWFSHFGGHFSHKKIKIKISLRYSMTKGVLKDVWITQGRTAAITDVDY